VRTRALPGDVPEENGDWHRGSTACRTAIQIRSKHTGLSTPTVLPVPFFRRLHRRFLAREDTRAPIWRIGRARVPTCRGLRRRFLAREDTRAPRDGYARGNASGGHVSPRAGGGVVIPCAWGLARSRGWLSGGHVSPRAVLSAEYVIFMPDLITEYIHGYPAEIS
jgi:hypothetical protein